jgi:hypothetical protein
LNYDRRALKPKAWNPEVDEMTSAITYVAAVVAGLAIVATAFILPSTGRGLLKGVVVAVALAVTAALLITAARSFG